ncbi:MAG: hypothetical protein ACI9T8_000670 [Candidatus Saccharimonadales bacterium]|jgi:hypothetical protein
MATTKKTTKKTASKAAIKSKKTTTKSTKAVAKKLSAKKVSAAAAKKTVTTKARFTKSKSPLMERLNLYNWALAAIYAAQAAALVKLSDEKLFQVTTSYTTTDSLAESTLVQGSRTLFDINIVYVLAFVLGVSALTHLYLAYSAGRTQYEKGIKENTNKLRWANYSLGGSVLVAAISMVIGVTDLASLLMIMGLTSTAFALNMASSDETKESKMMHMFKKKLGLLPWLVIGLYVLGSHKYGGSALDIPTLYIASAGFVGTLLIEINSKLTSKSIGRWADYIYSEQLYMLFSLALTSTVVWLIFLNLLSN